MLIIQIFQYVFFPFLVIYSCNHDQWHCQMNTCISDVFKVFMTIDVFYCYIQKQIDFCCFNTTFSNISAISWRSVLVVEEAGVPGENHRQATGKLYHLRLRVECTLFCNLQSRVRTHAVLVIDLSYQVIQLPNSLSHPCPYKSRTEKSTSYITYTYDTRFCI